MPMLSMALRRVMSEDAFVAKADRAASKAGGRARADGRTLIATLNHGRWVALCPNCNAGIAIHPAWTKAACLGDGCHRVYAAVTVPENWREIEEIVVMRDVKNRNWQPGESADLLRADNISGGLAPDRQHVIEFERETP